MGPRWESPPRPLGGIHHALGVAPPEITDVYRGMARLVANATCTMNVTAPRTPMDYFFEHQDDGTSRGRRPRVTRQP